MSLKEFADLSIEEKAALGDDAILLYRRLAAAREGVPLPADHPGEAPTLDHQPDAVIHNVGNEHFTDRGEAEEVAAAINRQRSRVRLQYGYKTGYDRKTYEPVESEVAISAVKVFSPIHFANLAGTLENYHSQKTIYDNLLREHTKTMSDFDKASGRVQSEVDDARDTVRRRQQSQKRFNEYLSLAGGDARTAWTFFEKAGYALPDWRPVGAPVVDGPHVIEPAEGYVAPAHDYGSFVDVPQL